MQRCVKKYKKEIKSRSANGYLYEISGYPVESSEEENTGVKGKSRRGKMYKILFFFV